MAKKNNKRSKKAVEDDDEDEEDEVEEDDDDDDAEPVKKKKKKVVKKKAKDDEDDDDEDDEDDDAEDDDEDDSDDEEDDDDEPVKKSKKKSRDEENDEDEDEDDDDDDNKAKWYHSDVKKMKTAGTTDRFKFEDGETYEVMFLKDSPFVYQRHFVPSANQGKGGYLTCPTPGKCPICKAGNSAGNAAAFDIAITDKGGKQTQTIAVEGARFAKKFQKQKSKRGTLQGVVFEISKTGKKMDTDWDLEFSTKRKLTKTEKAMLSKLADFKKMFQPKSANELKAVAKTINSDDDDD